MASINKKITHASVFRVNLYKEGIYIAKIHFENGALSTQKLINTK